MENPKEFLYCLNLVGRFTFCNSGYLIKMKFYPRIVIFAIIAITIIFLLTKPFYGEIEEASEVTQVPKDFSLMLHAGGRLPEDMQFMLIIEQDGKGKYIETSERDKDEFVLKDEFLLEPMELLAVYRAVVNQKFFDLKSEYRDTFIFDGSLAEMEITSNGKTHRVAVINIDVEAFNYILKVINEVVPPNDRIYVAGMGLRKIER